MSTPVPVLRHPWALAVGLVLLVPQVVLAVVVVKNPFVVGIAGFLMTIGFIRLGSLGYRVLRERRPERGRGALVLAGAVATVAGALLYGQVALAARASGDETFRGAIAPAGAVGLNLVVILVLGLWITGVVLVIASILGAVSARRAAA